MDGKMKTTKKITLIETHMTMDKGTSLFSWKRETYLRLNKELETFSKIFQVFPLQDTLFNQSLKGF